MLSFLQGMKRSTFSNTGFDEISSITKDRGEEVYSLKGLIEQEASNHVSMFKETEQLNISSLNIGMQRTVQSLDKRPLLQKQKQLDTDTECQTKI